MNYRVLIAKYATNNFKVLIGDIDNRVVKRQSYAEFVEDLEATYGPSYSCSDEADAQEHALAKSQETSYPILTVSINTK